MGKPAGGPQAGAAMVPAVITLAGGAGMTLADACAKIFAQFDPPIVTGTYSAVSRQRQRANARARRQRRRSGYENNQSEHYVPNSALQKSRGGANVPGAQKYTEGSGFAYSVYDDQSRGTEHKWLTDRAARDARSFSPNPTLEQQLNKAKARARDGLLEKLQREAGGKKRDRIKDSHKRTPKERAALAAAAAECLDLMAREQFKKQKVAASTTCRKGMNADAKRRATSGRSGNPPAAC